MQFGKNSPSYDGILRIIDQHIADDIAHIERRLKELGVDPTETEAVE